MENDRALRDEARATGCAPTAAGARKWARAMAPAPHYETERQYTKALRAILRRSEDLAPYGALDGRLLAVGFNVLPPRELAPLLPDWWAVWREIAARPERIGSNYNPDPSEAFKAWRRGGLPLARAYGQLASAQLIPTGRTSHPRQVIRAGRAIVRQSARQLWADGYDNRDAVSLSLWAFLGRIGPEAQAVVLDHLKAKEARAEWRQGRPFAVLSTKNIDWAVVGPKIKALQNQKVRASWACGRRQATLLGVALDDVVEALCPAYPRVSLEVAQRIARGESPVQIAGPLFTKKEAHQWCLAGAPSDVIDWWLSRQSPDLAGITIREPEVARWLAGVRQDSTRWAAITRTRQILVPGRGMVDVVFIDKIDEISAEDIPHPRASVEEVYRRAGQRVGETFMAEHEGDNRILCARPSIPIYPRCCRWLRTNAELIREGREMDHCVGGYGTYVESGTSLILALRVGAERSTVEIDPQTLAVRQHFGPGNNYPAPVLQRLVAKLERKWKRWR